MVFILILYGLLNKWAHFLQTVSFVYQQESLNFCNAQEE